MGPFLGPPRGGASGGTPGGPFWAPLAPLGGPKRALFGPFLGVPNGTENIGVSLSFDPKI